MMKNIKNIYTLLVVALIGLSLAACSKDDLDTNQYVGGVSLNVYGPTPVMRGGQLRFLGSNLDQVSEVIIPSNISVTNIKVVQAGVPSEIQVTVPKDGPVPGLVTLVTKSGERISTITELNYVEGIEITSFPASAMPGDIIKIEGDYLNLIYSLAFADGVIVSEADFVSHDRYAIEVRVPDEAKTGKIEFYTADLTVIDKSKVEYQIIQTETAIEIGTPTISGIKGREQAEALGNITAKAGETISITGTYFNVVSSVTVGGVTINNISIAEDGSTLTFTLPAEAPDGSILLVCKSGVEVPAGTLTTIKPTNCVASPNPVKAGQTLTITGNDMDVVTDVIFADSKGDFVLSNNQNMANTKELYAVIVPEAAIEGNLKLAMANGEQIDVPFTLVKPTITGYNVNPASAGSPLQITGTDLDLIKDITFGEAKNDADKFEVNADGTQITVTVPMAGKSGKPKFNLANGTSVEGQDLTINEAVFCYFTELPAEDAELKAGESFILPVANSDKLTGVEINGEACQYVLSGGDKLIVGIPATAKKGSSVRLISSNGEITYTFDFIPNTEVTTVLWTGTVDLGSWSINWEIGKGVYGDNNPNMFKDMDLQEGDVIRVSVAPYNDWWNVKFYDGHWAAQDEAGIAAGVGATPEINPNNYNPADHGGTIEFTATAKMVEQLTTITDWGMCWIINGEGVVITKIAVTHYNSLETTLWEGNEDLGQWSNQPYILSDGGAEFKELGVKAGQIIRCYGERKTDQWQLQVLEGHWSNNDNPYGNWGYWDNTEIETNGCLAFELTQAMIDRAYQADGWGGVFVVQGQFFILKKITIE